VLASEVEEAAFHLCNDFAEIVVFHVFSVVC
jgi:hypothetical protein